MPCKPAARVSDAVAHPAPPVLTGGPGAFNVLVGGLPAWRAIPTAAVAALQATQKSIDTALRIAENVAAAAAGSDIHACLTPWPVPPHGSGVDIEGSPTVMVTGRHKISRQGDQILEAIGGMSS